MAQLDTNKLLNDMFNAIKQSLGDKLPAIESLAKTELKKIAQNLVDIEQMKVDGILSQEKAKLQIEFQKNVLKTILLTEEGLGLLAVEAAIKAALDVVRGVVNRALGFAIL